MQEITMVVIMLANLPGVPDQLAPAPDIKFATVRECKAHVAHMNTIAPHPRIIQLCLDAASAAHLIQK